MRGSVELINKYCSPFEPTSQRVPKSLREQDLLQFMAEIRRKPEWTTKIFNEKIVSKWRSEVLSMEEAIFQFGIDECRYYASKATKACKISAVDGVYESDHIIDSDLRSSLQFYIQNVIDTMDPDWHPKSNDLVLDIIHPSLFPVIYGTSKFYIDEKSKELNLNPLDIKSFTHNHHMAEVMEAPSQTQRNAADRSLSLQYQWLPADVMVTRDSAKFTSYINNLHPAVHPELYDVLGKLVYHFCPLFEAVFNHAITFRSYLRDANCHDARKMDEEDDDSDYSDYYSRRTLRIDPWDEKFDPTNYEISEEPKIGFIPENESDSTKLQIVVKAANIHLTPDNPQYGGGSWHVEGMKNERIVATGLYYYDNCNITQSRLDFRVAHDDPDYEQNDKEFVKLVYGLEDDDLLQCHIGGVETNEGRMIAFPNNYQHQVQPFELEDKTKPGHRKIIALFLIDPFKKVPSSSSVLPQNELWWEGNEDGLENVSPDCRSVVYDYRGFPYTLKTAKMHRDKLMEERSILINSENEEIVRNFSLCEH